jgi:hypothetical protein
MPSKKSKKEVPWDIINPNTVVDNKKLLNTDEYAVPRMHRYLNTDAGGLTDKVTHVVDYGEIPSNTPQTSEKETKK